MRGYLGRRAHKSEIEHGFLNYASGAIMKYKEREKDSSFNTYTPMHVIFNMYNSYKRHMTETKVTQN